jgi:hypothetical protein
VLAIRRADPCRQPTLWDGSLELRFHDNETVRSWVLKFGPMMARRLRQRRPRPSDRWHLDEMVVRIAGKPMYLWRAVDHEGEILDVVVQRRRDKRAAVKLMRKLLRKQAFAPKMVVTDELRPTALPSTTSGSPATASKDFEKTIGPRTRTKGCDDASARCSGSNHPDLPNRGGSAMAERDHRGMMWTPLHVPFA